MSIPFEFKNGHQGTCLPAFIYYGLNQSTKIAVWIASSFQMLPMTVSYVFNLNSNGVIEVVNMVCRKQVAKNHEYIPKGNCLM